VVVRVLNRFVCFLLCRDKTAKVIIDLVEYSSKFATYSILRYNHSFTLLEHFARRLYPWRRPYPKFRQSQVGEPVRGERRRFGGVVVGVRNGWRSRPRWRVFGWQLLAEYFGSSLMIVHIALENRGLDLADQNHVTFHF